MSCAKDCADERGKDLCHADFRGMTSAAQRRQDSNCDCEVLLDACIVRLGTSPTDHGSTAEISAIETFSDKAVALGANA